MNEVMDLITLKNVLKVLVFVILFGYVIYSFLMTLRVKILSQTVKTNVSQLIQVFGWIHFIVVVASGLVIAILILS